ncbi:hypothetical protein [Butyrivibrio sp.]|uniref:hypothetical protein n=1 Tax=Butyrivibrio sp. TaxID=28121 RepID=UPI0025C6CA26|nr:hypothetical protein [Butyrivibrio sp.]MBQ7430214.1 hypothetical protein [Butyrivibrio sp.]MBQ9303389.1 hypothetical protein [Butyrivibrio sp.]
MAVNDYNPVGGTSQATITKYHMQMADIDRQLYETGKYTGPVPDLKKGVVEVQTLERKEAQKLKHLLWYQADKLEGYSWSERHARKWYEKIAQGIAGFFKLFNIPYQIRRFKAQKLYDQAMGNVYQNESLYEAAAAMAQSHAQTEQPPEQDKEFDPAHTQAPQARAVVQSVDTVNVDKTNPDITVPKDEPEPEIPVPAEEKPDKAKIYHDKFYAKVAQLENLGHSKEEAMIQLLQENPIGIYNIDQQDITPAIAAHAILLMADKEHKEPTAVLLQLVNKVPAIVMADNKLDHTLDRLFKVIPTAIEHNQETIKYLRPNQITPKTVQFTLGDIEEHKGTEAKEQFIQFVAALDTPAAQKFTSLVAETPVQEQTPPAPQVVPTPFVDPSTLTPPTPPVYTPPQTPLTPPPAPIFTEPVEVPVLDTIPDVINNIPEDADKYDNWRYNPDIADAMEKVEATHSEIFAFPEADRDEMTLNYLMEDYPYLYPLIADEDKNLTMSAIAVMNHVDNIIESPFTTEALCDQIEKIAKTKSSHDLDYMLQGIDSPAQGDIRNDETDMIREVLETQYNHQLEKEMREYNRIYDPGAEYEL